MLLIAIDTSGRNGSVALCRADENSFTALQLIPLEGGTYSTRLMPTMAELLANQQVSKKQIDALVVVSGPGSFTGLRVGLATVKGLCEVLQKPLVAVSMLEAVAVICGPADGRITVVLDAGRGEVYVGEFELANSRPSLVRENITKLEAFAAGAGTTSLRVLSPDAKIVDSMSALGTAVQQVDPVRADEIARVGMSKFLFGTFADPATLDANYIRRSDAELFSAPKR
jgi:tRNA threonylcarbamoyladenosine biosynthesis protein TsaB